MENFMWTSPEQFLFWFPFFSVSLMDIHTLIEHTAHRSHLDSLGVLHCILSLESPHMSWKWPRKQTGGWAKTHRKMIQVESAWEQKSKTKKRWHTSWVMNITRCSHYLVSWLELLLFLGLCELLSEWDGTPADCLNPDIHSCCARMARWSF